MARFVKFTLHSDRPIWINPELVTAVFSTSFPRDNLTVIELLGVTCDTVVKGSPADVADLLSSESAAKPAQGAGELSSEKLAEFQDFLAWVLRGIREEAAKERQAAGPSNEGGEDNRCERCACYSHTNGEIGICFRGQHDRPTKTKAKSCCSLFVGQETEL